MRGKDYYLSAEYREIQERNNEFPNMCDDDDDRMRKDRLADYAPMPSEAFLKSVAAERERKRKLKDKTHK